ncbi:MAG: PDZ domain-containing protein [Gemmatimonadetes bacterium]|nr:PDZ domain-containing protein [Gemmatimonadota bacterium]
MTLALVALFAPQGARASVLQEPAPTAVGIRRVAPASLDSTIRRLVEELEVNRQRELSLVKQLSALRDSGTRTPTAGMWKLDSTGKKLMVQLRDASRGIFRTQAQLMALCERGGGPPGWIGITFENQSMVMRREDGRTGLAFSAYPRIVDVAPGSPAEKAGIVKGDSIVELGSTDVTKGDVRFDLLLRPGMKLPVAVSRNGERRSMTLVVGKRPNEAPDACSSVDRTIDRAMQPAIVMLPDEAEATGMLPRMRTPRAMTGTVVISPTPAIAPTAPMAPGSPEGTAFAFTFGTSGDYFAGAELRRLSTDLAELTGAEDGVFVVSVAAQSLAEKSGLKGGDVIVRANEMPVVRPDQLARALMNSDDGTIRLVVVRKRAKQSVVMRVR